MRPVQQIGVAPLLADKSPETNIPLSLQRRKLEGATKERGKELVAIVYYMPVRRTYMKGSIFSMSCLPVCVSFHQSPYPCHWRDPGRPLTTSNQQFPNPTFESFTSSHISIMGSVFSCLASTFMYLGEFFENVFLAMGEVGAVLARAIFGIIVGLCDVLAAISCCWRVPYSERPDRSFYTYSTNTTSVVSKGGNELASVGGKQLLASIFTKEGREQRKEVKMAKEKAAAIRAEEVRASRDAKKAEAKAQKKAAELETEASAEDVKA